MADGKVSIAYSSFLGYDVGDDGYLYIIEEQAEIVGRIYDEYLAGKTTYDIDVGLTVEGIPIPMKNDVAGINSQEHTQKCQVLR